MPFKSTFALCFLPQLIAGYSLGRRGVVDNSDDINRPVSAAAGSVPALLTGAQPLINARDGCWRGPPATPQPGTDCACDKWHVVAGGETCGSIITAAAISSADFFRWNPNVGGAECKALWLGYSVCIHGPGGAASAPTSAASSAAASTAPGPTSAAAPLTSVGSNPAPSSTQPPSAEASCSFEPSNKPQPGTNCKCTKFVRVGGTMVTCDEIIRAQGISAADFHSWNPNVGAKCETLWKDYDVCVAV